MALSGTLALRLSASVASWRKVLTLSPLGTEKEIDMFTVVSFVAGVPHSVMCDHRMYDHGSVPRYAGAANLARIVRRTFPGRTVLVVIPKKLR